MTGWPVCRGPFSHEKTTNFPVSPRAATLGAVHRVVNNFPGQFSLGASKAYDELQSLVQELSTSCCFVSNFEISGAPAHRRNRLRRVGPAMLRCNRSRWPSINAYPEARPGQQSPWAATRGPVESPLESRGRREATGTWKAMAGPAICFFCAPCHERHLGVAFHARHERWRSRPISRVLSWTVIPLGASSPIRSSSLPGPDAGRVMRSLFGLAPGGVCRAGLLPGSRCALTAPFHPCHASRAFQQPDRSAVSFCCTFRRLAPPRRYLAPCPVEPGLSSASARLHDPMTRLSGRLRRVHCRTRPPCGLTRGRTAPCVARR